MFLLLLGVKSFFFAFVFLFFLFFFFFLLRPSSCYLVLSVVSFISALVSGKGPNVAIAGCGAIFDKTLFLGLLAKWILEQNQS